MDVNILKRKNYMQDNEDDLIILTENQNDNESKRAHYLSYTDRYFKRYYKLDVRYKNNDHLILMHSNRIAVSMVAQTHPILNKEKYKIDKVEYIQQVNEEMSGKHKHFAKNLNILQPLCKVYCTNLDVKENELDQVFFVFYSCLNAKLLETNEKLLKNPEILQKYPQTEGYLAIVMPKLDNLNEQIADLITHEQYLKCIQEKQTKKENETCST